MLEENKPYKAYCEAILSSGHIDSDILQRKGILYIINDLNDPDIEIKIHKIAIKKLLDYVRRSSFTINTRKEAILENLLSDIDIAIDFLSEISGKYKDHNLSGINNAKAFLESAGTDLAKIYQRLELKEQDKKPPDGSRQKEFTEWKNRQKVDNDEIIKLGTEAKKYLEAAFDQLNPKK